MIPDVTGAGTAAGVPLVLEMIAPDGVTATGPDPGTGVAGGTRATEGDTVDVGCDPAAGVVAAVGLGLLGVVAGGNAIGVPDGVTAAGVDDVTESGCTTSVVLSW